MIKSYYNCQLFDQEIENLNNFVVKQEELSLDKVIQQSNSIESSKYSFLKEEVKYICSFEQQSDWHPEKVCVLIPTKDNLKLLNYTIRNLLEHKIHEIANIIIIDDRSTEDLKSAVLAAGFSYLRVDNEKGFNFSMLNNIAAKICYDKNIKEVILWNSDLWCVSKYWLMDLLAQHEKESATITGTKLIYPPKNMSLNNIENTENIKRYFPEMLGKWRDTVQFGGDMFYDNAFHHYGRFKGKLEHRVNSDRGATFITGAFQIINLEKFIKLGGLNPSLAKNFQDVDWCLKVIEYGDKVLYLGKDKYFYHDESAILHDKKNDQKMVSDQILFYKRWPNLVGLI